MRKMVFIMVATLLLTGNLAISKTLVTVNGNKIDDSIIPKGYEKLDDTKRAELMERLIKEELVHAYLLKTDIVNDPEFKEIFEKQKKIAEKQYKKISGKNLTKEQIRNIKGSIAIMLYQKRKFEATTATDAEAREFYQNNRERFNFPDSIEIANIITKTEQEAKQIIKRLKKASNLKEEFVKIAREYKQNGYMGWFGRGQAPENLFNASFKAKPKTLLDKPVKTQHGYHVIYLLNKKNAGQISYEEAKENIKRMLRKKKVVEALRDKIDTMYGNADIVY